MIKERVQKSEEIIRGKVKNLFESYGFEEYKMRMFEKYSLYLEHKDFLVGEKIITFTDLGGELMALRPDVTLSIVKNAKADGGSEKLYYCENVYRGDKQNGRFREINQLGLELIGHVGGVEKAEIIGLALGALSVISSDFVLELSHIGFVCALFEACGFDEKTFGSAKLALKAGNENKLRAIAAKNGLSGDMTDKLCGLVSSAGTMSDVLPKMKNMIASAEMQSAYDELYALYEAMRGTPDTDKLRLDFSLTGEETYYNGIVMSGFVRGVPKAVLSGGQYDKLMQKLDKNAQAIGFALYLGELAAYLNSGTEPVDVLIVYGSSAIGAVMEKARKLRAEGLSVRTEKTMPCGAAYKKLIDMEKGK